MSPIAQTCMAAFLACVEPLTAKVKTFQFFGESCMGAVYREPEGQSLDREHRGCVEKFERCAVEAEKRRAKQ